MKKHLFLFLFSGIVFSCSGPGPSATTPSDLPPQTGQESTTPPGISRTDTLHNEEYYDPEFKALPMKSSWVLDRLNGMELAEAELRGEVPTLSLDLETGKASGNGGCNRYNSSVKIAGGNSINFGHLISTKMACQSQPLENAYFGVLNFGLLTYSYTPERLTIKRDVRSVLDFRPAK